MELRTISTTYEGKERRTEEQVIPFCDDGGRERWLINLYPQVTYQQMDGFGGAITESAAYVYSLMDPEQKKQMLDEYFGKGEMRYRFVRIPIDSCDFSLGHYEADGNENDAQLEAFPLSGSRSISSRCWRMRKSRMAANWKSCCPPGVRLLT